nr:hypothetical protein [Aneurinibacillus sp. XH2]
MFLSKRIIDMDDHFSVSHDLAVPISKSFDPAAASFCSAEILLQIVVRLRNVVMIVAGEQPFPETT